MLGHTVAALDEEGRVLLGELRTRGGDDWTLTARNVSQPWGSGVDAPWRPIDLAVVPNHRQACNSIVFILEGKNKERCLAAHHIKQGKVTMALKQQSYSHQGDTFAGVDHER